MRAFKTVRRIEPDWHYTEPRPYRADAWAEAAGADDAPALDVRPADSPDAMSRDADAVLDLIDAVIAADALASREADDAIAIADAPAAGGPIPARDLMHSLYEQYCGALENPQASPSAGWAAQMTAAHRPLPDLRADAREGVDATDSIAGLLSGARVLDDAFGPLTPGDGPDPAATEPVPEILRLFAPAEYHATAARRQGGLPPALTRQEHQTLAIDSPLPASAPAPACNAR
ncbi:TagK domain-containing protein [Burkholderia ubonensis]|uniref:TagK domain-containing protein n=1 Tax=Burkholderia ubonensis TaxID=101571 RepID=UPI000BA64950|nr:TagK domain-containing protein [Burkholderia ubonensis]PAJ89483.1 type VI secretion protein [Burkholderia ubonensis]PAJ95843.1 type VI secretion protein [Burkholderia ubonensis]PAK03459.1 type VI secretion protein [Burkholderia ubonensis]RQP73963.1 TagK domain-containing protein [Burkholderia ubonensis]RQP86235.1 TagK domain-containing protein [Burkholderia ubonensis]